MKIKKYIILSILLLSLNTTSSSNNTTPNYFNQNMDVAYVDVNYDGFFDEIHLTMEIDISETTDIQAYMNLKALDKNYNYEYYGSYSQIINVPNAGVQNITIIFSEDFFNTYFNGTMNFEMYLYKYDSVNYNNELINDYYASKDFNYKDFNLPMMYIDYDNIQILYFDSETNQSIALNDTNNSVDTIILRVNVTQTVNGQFNMNGYMKIINSNDYTSYQGDSKDYYDNRVAGNYTIDLLFSSYGFNDVTNGEPLDIKINIYLYYGYYNDSNYESTMVQTNYIISDILSPELFEANIVQFEYVGMNHLDLDNSGLTDTFEVIFFANFSKSLKMQSWISLGFYDQYAINTYEDGSIYIDTNEYTVKEYDEGAYNISFNLDTSRLYGKTVPETYTINYNMYYNLINDTASIWDYMYWSDLTMTHTEYDKPEVYISSVEIFPTSNNEGAPEYDFLEVKFNIEAEIDISLELYMMLEGVTETYYGWDSQYFNNYWTSEDITIGDNSISFFVNGEDLYNTEFTGDLGVALDYSYFKGDFYNSSNYVYDYKRTLFKEFDYKDYNPNGKHPDDPNYDPDDDSGVSTSDGSSDEEVQLPTLNLPAPPLYITMMGIFSMISIYKPFAERKRVNGERVV